jgi:hypothetical protein
VDDGYGDRYRDEGLLTIGAFAARARLSPKALRLYDRLGPLAPAYVDEASGYRHAPSRPNAPAWWPCCAGWTCHSPRSASWWP